MFHQVRMFDRYISVGTKSRSVKIAYLIEEDSNASENLNQIFFDAYSRWGGRYTLVVPLKNGFIASDEYRKWINQFDPDVIYTFNDINEIELDKINRNLCPIFFEKEKISNANWLSSRAVATPRNLGTLINIKHNLHNSRFLKDNFGEIFGIYAGGGFGTAPPKIDNEGNLLDKVNQHNILVTQRELSSTFCEVTKDASHPWNSGINLFIGNSFTDRISFWNSYLSDSKGTSNHKNHSLIVPPELFDNQNFILSFKSYLSKLPPAMITMRSNSLNDVEISNIANKLSDDTHKYQHIKFEKIESVNDCALREYYRHKSITNKQFYSTQLVNCSQFLLKFEQPTFLNNHSGQHEFIQQKFLVEVDIERDVNYSKVINSQHSWQLPPIAYLSYIFFGDANSDIDSRVTKAGDLICAGSQHTNNSISVIIPEDRTIFSRLLHASNEFPKWDLRSSLEAEKYFDHAISDKGYYLLQVLTLFGDVNTTFNYFDNEFCRNFFVNLSIPTEKNITIDNKINKKIKAINIGKLNQDDIFNLAKSLIYECAPMVKKPSSQVTIDDIINSYHESLKRIENYFDKNKVSLNRDELDNLEKSLQYLVSKSILNQGYIIKCKSCRFKNWINVQSLDENLRCAACAKNMKIPINSRWSFKINDILATAINDHGITPQILTLMKLRDDARSSFYFIPPVNLYSNDKKLLTDIDIFCIQDGTLIVGEAKSSDRDLLDVDELVKVAINLNASKFVVSAPLIEIESARKNNFIKKLQDKFKDDSYCPEVILYTSDDIKFYYNNVYPLP